MLVEGRGLVAPGLEAINLTDGDVEYLRRIAERRDRFRRYAQRRDAWGRGFIQHPTFVGLAGEHATCVYLNRHHHLRASLSIDSRLLPRGDEGKDIEIGGLVIQVKTIRNGNKNLIRRIDDRKRLVPLACGIYVFAKWWHVTRCVNLKGWIFAHRASELGHLEKSTVGNHRNLRIEERHLEPMNRLVDEIRLHLSRAA